MFGTATPEHQDGLTAIGPGVHHNAARSMRIEYHYAGIVLPDHVSQDACVQLSRECACSPVCVRQRAGIVAGKNDKWHVEPPQMRRIVRARHDKLMDVRSAATD